MKSRSERQRPRGHKGATETLAVGVQELGKKLYEQAAASRGRRGGARRRRLRRAGSQRPADDEVVDAEIVDEGTARPERVDGPST